MGVPLSHQAREERRAEHHDVGTELDGPEILADDHREFLALAGSVEEETDTATWRELADTPVAEIMRHAAAEEMLVYPRITTHVPNGPEEVEHDKAERQEIVLAVKRRRTWRPRSRAS